MNESIDVLLLSWMWSYQMVYIPMLCWVCCNTEPNAIKSLAGVRFTSDCGYPSPKYDASATALGGALDISVKIFLSFYQRMSRKRKFTFSCNCSLISLCLHSHYAQFLFSFSFFTWTAKIFVVEFSMESIRISHLIFKQI